MRDKRINISDLSDKQQERISRTVQDYIQNDTDFEDVIVDPERPEQIAFDPMGQSGAGWNDGWTNAGPPPGQSGMPGQYGAPGLYGMPGQPRPAGWQGGSGPQGQLSEPDREEPEEEPKSDRKKLRRDILIATYAFVLLFVGAIAYLGYFYAAKSDGYKSSSYNTKRQSIYYRRYQRGDILSADGKVLATSLVDEEGNQTRS